MKYSTHFSTRQTPQSQPIPGSTQVPNDAGGYAWAVDDWKRLDRFLILGSEGGTYYVSEQKLTRDNAEAVLRCIKADGIRAVNRIVEISEAGRAPKNDPALFALALAAAMGDEKTKRLAWDSLPKVARIGTHLFHFVREYHSFRGWSRASRQGIASWYNSKTPEQLAYQVVKYQQRDGWSHRDVLRLAHPKPASSYHDGVYNWIVKGGEGTKHPGGLITHFEQAMKATEAKEVCALIREHGLTWEMIPTQFLNDAGVWEALLEKMPLTAMVRNLGKMTAIELVKPMSNAVAHIVAELGNQEHLKKARLHPISLLEALVVYRTGHGVRGSLQWRPVSQVVDALDKAFYLSFGNVTSTGKRFCFGLDVSGSMSNTEVVGIPFLSCREACGAMALVSAAVEPNNLFVAFDTNGYNVAISPRQRLDDVVRTLATTGGGGTDCAIPILTATQHQVPVDVFVILTDNQTWYGTTHPYQALEEYRRKMGIPAKMVVVAMASSDYSIAAPDDGGCLDCVGFDTNVPELIGQFAQGEL